MVSLRYVERRTVLQAAQELNLSERQAHRDLRHGEERVATILWERRATLPHGQAEPRAIELTSFESELARLELHPRRSDSSELLRRAYTAVEPQASQRGVHIQIELPAEPVIVSLDPVMAEQVLVNLLSHAVEQAYPGQLSVTLITAEERVVLTLRYYFALPKGTPPVIDLVILQLVDRLGWMLTQADQQDGVHIITLQIARRGPTVLVVDDNAGLVDLLERYLTDQACRVVGATNGQEGLQLARELLPNAIILDVMMPEMHGWEFLQRLRAQPVLTSIPVIICSVINNPKLAYALGATLFLPKPVHRRDILDALQHVHVL